MSNSRTLITGSTGFIGGAATALHLQKHPERRTLLWVRDRSGISAEERVRQSLRRFVDLSEIEAGLSRCEIISGDFTSPFALCEPRLDLVTHVLHLAANTSFRSVRGVRRDNILGTLSLAHRMRKVVGLERFLYVSTAYLCGADPPSVVHEEDYPQVEARHIVEYTSSKAECELLLAATAAELPLVIARPSVVVGHTKLGCEPSSSIYWFYRLVDTLRRVTWPIESLDDVVPVDYVAESLLHLLHKPTLSHRCYHISAGRTASVTWNEIAEAFAEVFGPRTDNPYREVDFETVRAERDRLGSLLGPGDEEHLLSAIEIYYRFGSCPVEVFDNQRLLTEGALVPPKFTSYLATCARHPANRSVYEQMRDDE